jgi:hypothetical protein
LGKSTAALKRLTAPDNCLENEALAPKNTETLNKGAEPWLAP